MIKRIKINGYKSFRDFSLELRPLTVILGPNAGGKSNFLDVIYFLSRAVSQNNLKSAFEGHRGFPLESFYYGEEGYEGLLKKSSVQFSLEVDVELSDRVIGQVEEIVKAKRGGNGSADPKKTITQRFLRYQLTIEAHPKTGYMRINNERLCAIKPNGEEKRRNAFLEREGNRIHLRMEGQGHPLFHEIGLDHTIVSTALYEPHYPHVTAFRMDASHWQTYYLEPRALMREDVNFELHILKQLTSDLISNLKVGENDLLILADFGSGQLDLLKEIIEKTQVIVLDHHETSDISHFNLFHVNPLLFGEEELSA